jgi:hypothetical protein
MTIEESNFPREVEFTKAFHVARCSVSFHSDHFFGPGKRPLSGKVLEQTRAISRSSAEEMVDLIP